MDFVKVRHEDGREADITAAEVAQYRDMGFAPVDGDGQTDAAAETNVNQMTRDELNAHAGTVGVADAESFANKADLIAAIEAQQASDGATG